jgi:hypothetical protein
MNTLSTETLLWGLVASLVVPMLVALVAHVRSASWVKSILVLVLSALGSAATNASVTHLTVRNFLLSFAQIAALSVVAHMGFLSQFQITGAQGLIQRLIPAGVGQGTSDSPVGSGNAPPAA